MTLWILALGFSPEGWQPAGHELTALENKALFEWIPADCTEAGSYEGLRAQCSEPPRLAVPLALLGVPPPLRDAPSTPISKRLCCCQCTLSGAWCEDPRRPQCPHLQNGNKNFFAGFWDKHVL